MKDWYNSVAEVLEDSLRDECSFFDQLSVQGDLDIEINRYEQNPSISVLVEGEIFDTLYYQVDERYFYVINEGIASHPNTPQLRLIFTNLEMIVQFLHGSIHNYFDDETYVGANGHEDSQDINEKANNFEPFEGVQWVSNLESTMKIDVPFPQQIVTTLEFGEFENELIIKKKEVLSSDVENSVGVYYLKITKGEAEAIKEELSKYTA